MTFLSLINDRCIAESNSTLSTKKEMIMDNDIYKKLAKHLNALGMGYPEKEELTEILQENFTPQEAQVALAIPKGDPLEPSTVRDTPHVKISKKDLESILSTWLPGLSFKKMGRPGMLLQQFGYGFPDLFKR
jgi:hypothetical protein